MTLQELLDTILNFVAQLIELLSGLPTEFWDWLANLDFDFDD